MSTTKRQWAINAALVAMAISLVGCGSLQPANKDIGAPLRIQDSRSTQYAHRDQWWKSWEDPSLDSLMEVVNRNNADLKVAVARLKEAHARRTEVDTSRYPTLMGVLQSERVSQSIGRGGATQTTHRAGVTSTYEIDTWGRIAAQRSSASQDERASMWALATVHWSLSAQVAEAYAELRATQQKLATAQEMTLAVSSLVDILRSGVAAGVYPSLDLERAEADLASTEATISGFERLQVAQVSRLSLLAGEDVHALLRSNEQSGMATLSRIAIQTLPVGELDESLRRRPDLQEALAQFDSRDAALQASRRARWPRLTLSGDVGSDAARISQLFSTGGMFWSVAQSLTYSLFDAGAAEARTQQALARREAAQARFDASVVRATFEIREVYEAYAFQVETRSAQLRRVQALEKALSRARVGYELGSLAQLDLLDAQRQTLVARNALIDSERDLALGQVMTFKALGAGHLGLKHDTSAGVNPDGERS